MKIKFIIILIAIAVLVGFPTQTFASDVHSDPSAQLVSQNVVKTNVPDLRIKALKNIFTKYNSPLVDYADLYVKYADQNGLDWKLLPAISGLESTFGIHIPAGSYNAYGWGNGTIYFKSWEDGIKTLDEGIKTRYVDRGATDVWTMGPMYASSPTWAVRVDRFMNEINDEYQKITTLTNI
ncbi:MAG TPA: hypothetical protein VG965_00655 [Patescibacteria group bacterium]|nr:hypothetical protein [Patescibacteria group bacterium]